RASSRNTRNETIVSTRKVAICANISVLAELFAERAAAASSRRQRLGVALPEFFFFENPQRRLRRAPFGGHVLAQLRRRLGALQCELRRAQHAVLRELERVLRRNAGALGESGELLGEPEDIGRAAAGNCGHGV